MDECSSQPCYSRVTGTVILTFHLLFLSIQYRMLAVVSWVGFDSDSLSTKFFSNILRASPALQNPLMAPTCLRKVEVSRSVVSDSLQSHGLQPTRLLCPWDSPSKNTGVGCPPGHLPNPGIELASLMSPALAGRFFTTEPSGKPSSFCMYVCVCVYIYIY